MGWSSQLCNNYLRQNLFMELYAPSLNRPVATSVKFLKLNTNQRNKLHLRTVPTIVIAHMICASPDTRISYRHCILIQGYFCAV